MTTGWPRIRKVALHQALKSQPEAVAFGVTQDEEISGERARLKGTLRHGAQAVEPATEIDRSETDMDPEGRIEAGSSPKTFGEATGQIGVQAEDASIRELPLGRPRRGLEQTKQRYLIKDGKRAGVRCGTHLSVPMLRRTQDKAMASGEAQRGGNGVRQWGRSRTFYISSFSRSPSLGNHRTHFSNVRTNPQTLPTWRHFGNALQPGKRPPVLGPFFTSRSTRGLPHRGQILRSGPCGAWSLGSGIVYGSNDSGLGGVERMINPGAGLELVERSGEALFPDGR
jgi:hypothetical protein